MYFKTLLLLISTTSAAVLQTRQLYPGNNVCREINTKITGDVYYPLSFRGNFFSAVNHYMTSSSQIHLCVVEVESASDISKVLKIVGRTRTPFAVKSGGHASNPGFSSTTGVMIALLRINQIVLAADKKTVAIGLGNRWTDVYEALDGTGVNVLGGRFSGPGCGGLTLGGGYSWLTNQYGLTVDTVVSFNLVLPDGSIKTVSDATPDLFFALKSGMNRFGIVSSMILKTVPQPNQIYGGIQLHGPLTIPAVLTATALFQTQNTDPKAQIIVIINGGLGSQAMILFFYDGPQRPAAFQVFDNIPYLISTLKTRPFKEITTISPSALAAGNRGAFHTLSTTPYTEPFLKAVYNESLFYGALALLHGGILQSYNIEPFTDFGQYATDSAFGHANSPLPLNLGFSWKFKANDAYWRGVMQQSVDYLIEVAKREGIYAEGAYPNYALSTYSGEQLYGEGNAARLRGIQGAVDPDGVMGLAGGFTI